MDDEISISVFFPSKGKIQVWSIVCKSPMAINLRRHSGGDGRTNKQSEEQVGSYVHPTADVDKAIINLRRTDLTAEIDHPGPRVSVRTRNNGATGVVIRL